MAVAGAGARVLLDHEGTRIKEARIALGAVAPTPLLVEEAGRSLAGREPTEDAFTEAAKIAHRAAKPITDVRGTEPQRRHLIGVLVRRALAGALRRAESNHAAPPDEREQGWQVSDL